MLQCSSYGDDAMYDLSACQASDANFCAGTESLVQGSSSSSSDSFPVACDDLAWCTHFCSAACRLGTGSTCVLELASSLATTCTAISSHAVELKGDPGRNDATHAIAKSRSSSSSNVEEIYCDAHMLCKACTGDCLVPVVQEYFARALSLPASASVESTTSTAIAPITSVKYTLFAEPMEFCDAMGLLSPEASLYLGKAPSLELDPGDALRTRSALVAVPALVGLVLLAALLLLRWQDRPPCLGLARRLSGRETAWERLPTQDLSEDRQNDDDAVKAASASPLFAYQSRTTEALSPAQRYSSL